MLVVFRTVVFRNPDTGGLGVRHGYSDFFLSNFSFYRKIFCTLTVVLLHILLTKAAAVGVFPFRVT